MAQKFSLVAQIEEVERELAMRRRVYAERVASHKMKEGAAEYHTLRM